MQRSTKERKRSTAKRFGLNLHLTHNIGNILASRSKIKTVIIQQADHC